MQKIAMITLLTVILFNTLIASAYATTVSIEADISRDFEVVFEFADINEPLYTNIKTSPHLMNETTVPDTIWRNFVSKGHGALDALEFSDTAPLNFNDTAHSIRSTFHLHGRDIINSTVNKVARVETFRMSTEWRKFYLNVTNGFLYNFTQSLAIPLSDWTNSTVDGITSFSYSNPTAGVSCSFRLPSYASNIFRVGETIIFDAPYEPPWEDKLINSPILILIGLAIVGAIIFVYRKIR